MIRTIVSRIEILKNIYRRIELLKFRIYNFINYRQLDIFRNILIETHSLCNRKCKYCPVKYYPRKEIQMPDAVFYGIIDQLAEKNYKGEIGFHFYDEPLLDKRLPQFIRYTYNKCPESYLYFASNGDLLDIKTFRMLINEGLSHIIITQYDIEVRCNLRTLLNALNETEKKYLTVFKFGKYISNRGGSLKELQISEPRRLKCIRPDFQMVVNAEGKVMLCCNDYFGQEIMGDVTEENIFSIWENSRFKNIRSELRRGNRKNIDICSKCDFLYERYGLPKKRSYC